MKGIRCLQLLCVAALIGAGCSHRPVVQVEQVHEPQERAESRPRILPPRCADLPKAEYPAVATGSRPSRISVRVDLLIDEQGRPTKIRPTVQRSVDDSAPFAEAAVAAAERIVCEPAVRLPRPGSGETAPVPQRYRAALVYHFLRDQREATAVLR